MARKTVLIGIAAVAVVAIGLFALDGFPPSENGQGTIGVAERDIDEQMKATDIVLGDAEFQTWLQSDVVQRMIEDPEFTKVFANPEFQTALGSPEFQVQ